MRLGRKQRDFSELQEDPYFPFYVGRLVGATETVAHWLSLQDDQQLVEMARRLNAINGWFLGMPVEIPPEEAVTRVIPPITSGAKTP